MQTNGQGPHAPVIPVIPVVPAVPIGKIKSFGPFGPQYEVGRALRQLDDGDWMIEVKMVQSGETAEYRLTHLTNDSEAV